MRDRPRPDDPLLMAKIAHRLEKHRCVIDGEGSCKRHTVGDEKRWLFALLREAHTALVGADATGAGGRDE